MKDGIGAGYTREDHQDLANQLFSAYAKVGDARNLASVIGEDELSPIDKQYLAFGKEFEEKYIGQGPEENRTMEETLNLGWELLGRLPKEELDRVDTKILDKYYHPTITMTPRLPHPVRAPSQIRTKGGILWIRVHFLPKGISCLPKNSLTLAKQGYELMDKNETF